MSTETMPIIGYGYEEENFIEFISKFGLNNGNCRMVKFEYTDKAGKDGTEAEAIDIRFQFNGEETSRRYTVFPVNKIFLDSDSKTPAECMQSGDAAWIDAYKKAQSDWNRNLTHILHVFVESATLQGALARPIASFKEYVDTVTSLLPRDFDKIPLDIFVQYRNNTSYREDGSAVVYTEFPRKMTTGRWLSKAVKPVGSWKEVRKDNVEDNEPRALSYVDDEGNVHPFTRNGYFMNRNWAKPLAEREEGLTLGSGDPSEDELPFSSSAAPATNTTATTAAGW